MCNPEHVVRVERRDGVQLALRVYNSAAHHTVVLSSGLAGRDHFWRYIIDDLALDHCVVTWDYRGKGDSTSPKGQGAYSLQAHASDLAAVQSAVGAVSSVHVGFGMGAAVALAHGRRAPQALRALVLVEGGRGWPSPSSRPPLGAVARHGAALLAPLGARMARLALEGGRPRPLCGWARRLQLIGPTCNDDDLAKLVDSLSRQSLLSHSRLWLGLARAAWEEDVPEVPTLILGSRDDTYSAELWSKSVRDGSTSCEYEQLNPGSLATPLELGPVISHQTRQFLAAQLGRPSAVSVEMGGA